MVTECYSRDALKDLSEPQMMIRSANTGVYDVYQKLKYQYLPELKTLYDNCIWLTSKLELNGKRELQTSETRLIQFVSVVSSTIKQIEGLKDFDESHEWGKVVISIESKIVKTIIPVRGRLLHKLEHFGHSNNTNPIFDSDLSVDASKMLSSEKIVSKSLAEAGSISLGVKRTRSDDGTDVETLSKDSSNSSVSSILSTLSDNGQSKQLQFNTYCMPVSRSMSTSNDIHNVKTVISFQQPEQIPQIQTNSSTIYYSSATDPTINGAACSSNGGSADEEYVSSRRRRRLNQIVPNPRKPRQADYNCSVCNEPYSCVVQDNPWWAVYHHECPKCHCVQIPRIDISLSSNAVENDPNVVALYGEGIDDSGDEGYESESGSEADGNDNEEDEGLDNDNGAGGNEEILEDDVDDETPFDGEGLLAQEEASKLLVLMCHARTCSGYHASAKHAEICRSTKFLMLHIRDCTGRDIHSRECKFPWCLPCKKMLRHLTRCYDPATCAVCNPWSLPESYQQLRALNQMRQVTTA